MANCWTHWLNVELAAVELELVYILTNFTTKDGYRRATLLQLVCSRILNLNVMQISDVTDSYLKALTLHQDGFFACLLVLVHSERSSMTLSVFSC